MKQLPSESRTVDVAKFVRDLHERAELPYCCDPQWIVKAHGLTPCPWPTDRAFVRAGVLYYPERMQIDERGLEVLRAFAAHLGQGEDLVIEIALPTDVAGDMAFSQLGDIQPHVPVEWLRGVYARRRRASGFAPPG